METMEIIRVKCINVWDVRWGSITNNRDTWPVRLECWKVVTGNQPCSEFKMSTRQLTPKKKKLRVFPV